MKDTDDIILPENNHLRTLTERELEVLKFIVMGKSNLEIAKELFISVHTAKAHVCSILQKMRVNDRVQAAVKAVRENIV
jgi:DNA-binding NarL/FixJ family response regulator